MIDISINEKKDNIMKNKFALAAVTVGLGLGLGIAVGQDATTPQPPQRPGGPGRPMGPPPLMAALDANKDGQLDANEIANAATALRSLDKNGDGILQHEELMPNRPGGPGGQPGQRRGPGGPGGQRPTPPDAPQ